MGLSKIINMESDQDYLKFSGLGLPIDVMNDGLKTLGVQLSIKPTRFMKFFKSLKTLLPKENLVLVQFEGNIGITYCCASLSIFSHCIYISSNIQQPLSNNLQAFYEEKVQKQTIVEWNREISEGDIFIVFNQEIIQNQCLMDSKKIILVPSTFDTAWIANSYKFCLGLKIKINHTESLEIFRYSINDDFGEFAHIAKLLIDLVNKNRDISGEDVRIFLKLEREILPKRLTQELKDKIIDDIHECFFTTQNIPYSLLERNSKFLKYMFLILKELAILHWIKHNEAALSTLDEIFTIKYFNWTMLALFYNYDIACLLVSAVLSYHEDKSQIIFNIIKDFHTIKIIDLPNIVSECLKISYENILKNWLVVNRFQKLDNNEEILKKQIDRPTISKSEFDKAEILVSDTENREILENKPYDAEALATNELHSLIELIPASIILFPDSVELVGKTLVGGKISMKKCFFNIANSVGLARTVFILRHEISHKKWLLKGSNNIYSKKSPQATERFGPYQEAGVFTDSIIYGERPFNELPNLSKINEEMSEKIIRGDPLSSEELFRLYEPSPFFSNKSSGESGSRTELFCDGRFRRNNPIIPDDVINSLYND